MQKGMAVEKYKIYVSTLSAKRMREILDGIKLVLEPRETE